MSAQGPTRGLFTAGPNTAGLVRIGLLPSGPKLTRKLMQRTVSSCSPVFTRSSPAGMQAPGHFQTGDFSLDMQIPAGNSGGVNFAWYLMDTISPTNKDPKHSEIDFEIYGNTTAGTVLLTTNVFANGMQNLAQVRLHCNHPTPRTGTLLKLFGA